MKFTRPRDLAAVAIIGGLLAHLLLRLTYDSLPPLPLLAGSTLFVIAVVEAVFGFSLRARIQRRRGARPVQPLTAARAVVLAKASSVLGALMFGAWSGLLIFVLPVRDSFPAASNDLVAAVVGVIAAVALTAAALWLELCCKTPEEGSGKD
ncbi:Protein of unknown function [Lentzea albidocapillata subsp. violacea]|uniref:DUF3180 domain-containing protein n=1 Tax=Lentzea albidocapillata subsp. violacea TaxID=128104 RepID=A0A1G9HQ32_9PSEU|nr:DUF3180 domain-containing protein [Lentzea albidocapillata]SDL14945.1 Protein of unknown function [Lentzea albidocapillata subsp. violacea]